MNLLTQCLLANMTGCLKSNAGGHSFKFCLIPADEIDQYPRTVAEMAAPAAPAFGDEVCIGEPFTLKTTSPGWFTVQAICDTVGLNFNLIGQKGSFGFENKFLFFLAGMGKDQLQFAKTVASCCAGFIIKTKSVTGQTYIIGTPDNPAFIESIEGGSGVSLTERRGAPYVFRAPSACPPLLYDEDTHGITLAP